jgi:rare lipoprotein A (peptidoglycan hydrolase)
MRHSSENSREFCVRTLILGLFVVQGCSTLSRDQQPQVPPFDSQAGAVTTPGSDRSAKIESRKDDKGGSSATVQPAHIGEASWYGPGFQGKKTASGEIFDDSKLTAAHKTIPLGSKAKVTNITNGKTVEVKINDRGPFIDGRMVDLSRAAAKALGMIDRGTARVQIDLLPDINRERSENAPTMTIEESSRR